MFEAITRPTRHASGNRTVPLLVTTVTHAALLALLFAAPYLYATDQLPEVRSVVAFIAPSPAVAPPPPPPPAAPPQRAPRPAVKPKAAPVVARALPPVEVPSSITPEPTVVDAFADDEGIDGGIEGGVPGGVPGGVLGGIVAEIPLPAPPPPPAVREPVRVGGQIKAPALLRRVEPEYPVLAQLAKIEGMVILEAVVGEDGRVDDVRILRSAGSGARAMFDQAAITAVRQWEYSPLLLNGHREKFVLTVTLSFSL